MVKEKDVAKAYLNDKIYFDVRIEQPTDSARKRI